MIARVGQTWIAAAFATGAFINSARSDPASDLATCETSLKASYAVRHTVVWPAARMGISVEGGGPSSYDETDHWPFTKAQIVSQVRLGDPSKQTIESVTTVDRDVTGDASADASFSGDTITFTIHINKGWFGGGATAKARLQIVFRESDTDNTITSIGRICASKVLGYAKP